MKLTPILMAGGGGTHLWPLSTEHYPKQFLQFENAGDKILEIIEVQSGTYLGEDDIVRYDDDFGR